MARISITLPNNTLITLEWDEQESVHDVLAQVLHGLQLGSHPVPQSDAIPGHESDESAEKSSATPETREFYTAESPWEQTNGVAPGHSSNGIGHTSNGVAGYGEALPMASYADLGDDSLDLGRYTQEALEDFTAFCRSINPTGDMRRVVVAAEAANRFFGLEGVTADELGELFGPCWLAPGKQLYPDHTQCSQGQVSLAGANPGTLRALFSHRFRPRHHTVPLAT